MADYSSDFDFVEDDSRGKFVPVGEPLEQLRGRLARAEIDAAVNIYEETGGAMRDALIEEAKSASFETKKSKALMITRAPSCCWTLFAPRRKQKQIQVFLISWRWPSS